MKYDPYPALRDVPPKDDPRHRLVLAGDVQRAVWNVLLPNKIYEKDETRVREKITAENTRRWPAYGIDTHGQEDAEALKTYQDMRVVGWLGNVDAPKSEVSFNLGSESYNGQIKFEESQTTWKREPAI